MTTVTVFLPIQGDPVALHRALAEDPGRWLPDSRQAGEGRWTTVVHGAGVARTVVVRVSDAWQAGSTVWRTFSWDPVVTADDPERVVRYLPRLDGELGLDAVEDRASLVLDARYLPPGGPVGATVDALALHRVARGTVERFLADIAERLLVVAAGGNAPACPASDRPDPDASNPS